MTKQGGKPKQSTLYKGKPRPVKDEDWDAFVANEPKMQEKKFPLKQG